MKNIYIEEVHRISDDDCSTRETFSVYRDEYTQVSYVDPETGEVKPAVISESDTQTITFEIYKEQSFEKGLVSGWANVSKNVDGNYALDWQGDII